MCICPPNLSGGGDDDEDDWDEDEDEAEDEDDDEEDKSSGGGCGRPKCSCHKPINENPDHPWIITKAGYRKMFTMQILVTLRDPDNFSMYTYNDHAGYGVIEVLENFMLDFVDGAHSWKDQWIVCEAMIHFLLHSMSDPFLWVDDGNRVAELVCLFGTMFLSMLARLERENLLAEGSEAKDLGVMMALWMKFAADMRGSDVLDGVGQGGKISKANGLSYDSSLFDNYILAYADKFGIPVKGPGDIEEVLSQCDGGVPLPATTDKKSDPWGWEAALKNYESKHGTGSASKPKIGGDHLDITTWTSGQRKEASFEKKDPRGKKDMDAIKKGLVL